MVDPTSWPGDEPDLLSENVFDSPERGVKLLSFVLIELRLLPKPLADLLRPLDKLRVIISGWLRGGLLNQLRLLNQLPVTHPAESQRNELTTLRRILDLTDFLSCGVWKLARREC